MHEEKLGNWKMWIRRILKKSGGGVELNLTLFINGTCVRDETGTRAEFRHRLSSS